MYISIYTDWKVSCIQIYSFSIYYNFKHVFDVSNIAQRNEFLLLNWLPITHVYFKMYQIQEKMNVFLNWLICHTCIFSVPVLEFDRTTYYVDESEGVVHIPVIRHGDLDLETSVICYTRQQTAKVMVDYDERPYTDSSTIVFHPGENVRQSY